MADQLPIRSERQSFKSCILQQVHFSSMVLAELSTVSSDDFGISKFDMRRVF